MSIAGHLGRACVLVAAVSCSNHDAPGAALAIDRTNANPALALAFGQAVPQLPAISGDGASIASFASSTPASPPAVAAWYVAVAPVNRRASAERLSVVDMALANSAMRRLRDAGFASLTRLEIATNAAGEPEVHAGELVVSTEDHQNDSPARTVFELVLRSGQGKVLQQTKTLGYVGAARTSEPGTACGYRPFLAAAFSDAAKRHLYFQIGFHTTDDCAPPDGRWIAWPLP